MKKNNRITAFFLSLILAVSMLPVTVPAAGSRQILTGQVGIKGTPKVGETLTADLSGLMPADVTAEDLEFQWVMRTGTKAAAPKESVGTLGIFGGQRPASAAPADGDKTSDAAPAPQDTEESADAPVSPQTPQGTVPNAGAGSAGQIAGTADSLFLTEQMAGASICVEVIPKAGSGLTGMKKTSPAVTVRGTAVGEETVGSNRHVQAGVPQTVPGTDSIGIFGGGRGLPIVRDENGEELPQGSARTEELTEAAETPEQTLREDETTDGGDDSDTEDGTEEEEPDDGGEEPGGGTGGGGEPGGGTGGSTELTVALKVATKDNKIPLAVPGGTTFVLPIEMEISDTSNLVATKPATWAISKNETTDPALPAGLKIVPGGQKQGQITWAVPADTKDQKLTVKVKGKYYYNEGTDPKEKESTELVIDLIVKSPVKIATTDEDITKVVAGEIYKEPLATFELTAKDTVLPREWKCDTTFQSKPDGSNVQTLDDLGLEFDEKTAELKVKNINGEQRIEQNTEEGEYKFRVAARRTEQTVMPSPTPTFPLDMEPAAPPATQAEDDKPENILTDPKVPDIEVKEFTLVVEKRNYTLVAKPGEISFEELVGYTPQVHEITIINEGNVKLNLNKAVVEGTNADYFSILKDVTDNNIDFKPGVEVPLQFNFGANHPVGTYEATMRFIAHDELDPTQIATTKVKVKVEVKNRAANALAVTPNALDFGVVQEGYQAAPSPQQVTITNNGEEELKLRQPDAPKGFTISPLSNSIVGVKEKVTFTVAPKPGQTSDDYKGQFEVQADGTTGNSVSATVTVKFEVIGNNLESIVPPPSINGVENGVEKSPGGLGLPETVKIKTTKGEADAVINWNVEQSSYDPKNVDAHSFEVIGTIVLPDGITNPKNASTQTKIRVSVNGYEPKIPDEEELMIYNVTEGGTYDIKTDVSFTTKMVGNQKKPRKGDTRYVPESWTLGSSGESFKSGAYAGVMNTKKVGSQILSVSYAIETYDGSEWVATGDMAVKSMTLNFKKPDPADDPGNNGNNNNNNNNNNGDNNGTPTPTPTGSGTPTPSVTPTTPPNGTNNGGTAGGTANGVQGGFAAGGGTTVGTANRTSGAAGTATPVPMSSSAKQGAVKTGDASNPTLWAALMALAGATGALALFLRRKRN